GHVVGDTLVAHEIRFAGDAEQLAFAHTLADAQVIAEIEAARLLRRGGGALPCALPGSECCSTRSCRPQPAPPWRPDRRWWPEFPLAASRSSTAPGRSGLPIDKSG